MGYIVSAVVVNEANQVLMIQEAKYSCHGTWYLPAGRVEKNEDLVVRVLEREL
jgi:8-oxo-dGDP phosphatase